MADPGEARGLRALRGAIDAIDALLLRALAQRMVVAAALEAWKRARGLAVRDDERERALLDDRAAQARALGLDEGSVRALFAQVLAMSRAHQEALRAREATNLAREVDEKH